MECSTRSTLKSARHTGAYRCRRTALALACSLVTTLGSAAAQQPANTPQPGALSAPAAAGRIVFPPSVIPEIPPALPRIKLSAQVSPEAFMRDTLGKLHVQSKAIQPLAQSSQLASKSISESLVGAVENDQVRAYWHQQTGEAEVFPQFEKLTGAKFSGKGDAHLQRATGLARELFARPTILRADDTQVTVGAARPILGATAQTAANGKTTETAHELYLTYVPAFRSVAGHHVYGTGSRALLAMGSDGSVQGFLRRWKTGTHDGEIRETRTHAQVQDALTKLLEPMARKTDIRVDSVELAYYDSDEDALVPVYRVTVRIPTQVPAGAAAQKQADSLFVRYLAYGDAKLPDQLEQHGPSPTDAPKNVASLAQHEVPPGDPTVGRYVVRDAQSGFVDEANGFWDGLMSFGGSALFTNSQYYWAEPWMYTTSEASFMNSVNVALTEAHGSNWSFTTESNCCDVVNINAIPASEGYGAANKGKLAYWIIHSCAVIPSAADVAAWWTPWFKVFRGLHTVAGSRTEMYFDGGAVNRPFGMDLRLGAPVVSAWFNATLSYYSGDPPVDRPSTVSACGHQNDTVYNTGALPAANCLINFWQPD